MFDLDNMTRKKSETELTGAAATLFYQTEACRTLLEETMKFEGMGIPYTRKCTDDNIIDAVSGVESPLILIEVKEGLVELANKLGPLVGKYARVVLIGHEDKISVLRTVKELGFYYLFWPVDKTEVAVFLHFLQKDQTSDKGPQDARIARRIAVVGLKGGSGCTMISSELSRCLASETGQQVILADHAYKGSGVNIMLGKRDLARRQVTDFQSSNSFVGLVDRVDAQSLLTQIDSKISYLGFEAQIGTGEDLREYVNSVLEPLKKDANFIVEDYSASAKFYPNPDWLCNLVNCAVVVIQPTMTSLFETKTFLEEFKRANERVEKPVRLILMLNHCYSKDSIQRKAIEQYLETTIDVELPYYRHCEDFLSSGKSFTEKQTPLQQPLQTLTRMILGKPVGAGKQPGAGLFSSFKSRKVSHA
ncbi:AAA family ATPase [Sansalvadorimonas sp. 2012CJ34-2]|uniref:AAA family ATPase n=1 Tax=Parendozoicomonas callyspongiae TaxID=2942213 RepID=A0ABT0PJC2_9GAMM|nr:AAA family ATPase [Sansalvadorimonas sp. 2012CJ34-2]MCL6271458.1 AAA family ATPase [Sansalvadorimonas sp. 2012CJ34-2]